MGEKGWGRCKMLFESLYTIQNNSCWGFYCALYFAPLFPDLVLALLFLIPEASLLQPGRQAC